MNHWFLGLQRRLDQLDGESPAAYVELFAELESWRNRLCGEERKALEAIWQAAVAYLYLDFSAGDALRRQAARRLDAGCRLPS
jgi:hypothetical protein